MVKDLLILELLELARTAESMDDIHHLCARICREFGYDSFLYGARLPTSLVNPQVVILSDYPDAWWGHYVQNRYIHSDPVVHHCTTRITPVIWEQLKNKNEHFDKGQISILHEAGEFGLRSGSSFPIHGGNCGLGILSLVSQDDHHIARDRIDRSVAAVHLLSAHIHEAARRVSSTSEVKTARKSITPREKECLLWLAEGKTTWEIAKILGVSERTVRFHLNKATAKLQVSNRSQAVARAISLSIITPQF